MREAEGELERAAPLLNAVAGADHLEALGVALGDALDVVRDQGAGEAVQRARLALVVRTGHDDLSVFELGLDRALDDERQLALRALDHDILAIDGDGHAAGDIDGHTSDS